VTDEGIFSLIDRLSAMLAQNYVLLFKSTFCRALPYDLPKRGAPSLESLRREEKTGVAKGKESVFFGDGGFIDV
jgi:hypothetical protein